MNKKKNKKNNKLNMKDILSPDFLAHQGLFEKTSEIALYYGFKPIGLPLIERGVVYETGFKKKSETNKEITYKIENKHLEDIVVRTNGRCGVIRAYIENMMYKKPQPVMLYYYEQLLDKKTWGKEKNHFGFEMIGTTKNISDAIIIKILLTILEEVGFKKLCVHINSIGDKDGYKQYLKELSLFYKKHDQELKVRERQFIANPAQLLHNNTNERLVKLNEMAPDTMASLNTASKKHLREVLEYLDAMGVPYEIKPNLLPEDNDYSQVLFEIVNYKEDANSKNTNKCPILAQGGRYIKNTRKIGGKKEVHGVSATLNFDTIIHTEDYKKINPRIIKTPKIFFIQLGFEAKLKSLSIIEILRKTKVPIQQSLTKDKLSTQLIVAENLKVPYTMILGQREALDDTVIIRKMENGVQKVVPIKDLVTYIKKYIK